MYARFSTIFFVNVAKDIGSSNYTPKHISKHPSVIKIILAALSDVKALSFALT